jgi:glycosyltransferase involved in cell wall biosynthesis
MKLVYFTAGAAGMYCGSCMLDNALAKAMIRQGDDCLLVPLYTPIRTDEEDVSAQKVFFGGVNVFLQQKFPLARYLPSWMDSFLNQPWIIRKLTANTGKTSPKLLGSLAVSMLRGIDGYQRKEVIRLCDWLAHEDHADAIVLTNLLIGGCIPELRRRLKVPIYVILQGDDIFLDSLLAHDREQVIQAMKKLVPQIEGFVVYSRDYGNRMASLFDIPFSRINVVPLGIDLKEFQPEFQKTTDNPIERNDKSIQRTATDDHRRFRIGYFARMSPEKGLHLLVDAFIDLTKRLGNDRFELSLAGWLGPQHETFWNEQKSKLCQAGLDGNWSYAGSIDRQEKVEFLRQLDLFCVPTTYAEPKGLFVLEAVAAGVPYLQPNHGAFPEMHERLQSGWLFEANNPNDLLKHLVTAVRQSRFLSPENSSPTDYSSINNEDIPILNRPLLNELSDEISIDRMARRFREVVNQ